MGNQPQVISELDGEQTAVQIRTVATRGGVVVLCCHNQDRVDLELVANRLQGRGCLVEMVGTIDMDSGALSSAIDHHGDSARFVFCKTARFGPRQIAKYHQFLLSLGVKESSILNYVFNENNPNDLIEKIVKELSDRSLGQEGPVSSGLLPTLKKTAKNLVLHQILFVGGVVALMLVSGLALLYLSTVESPSPATGKTPPPPPATKPDSTQSETLEQQTRESERSVILEEQRIIDNLVRQKKIRSLDSILILITNARPMGFADALEHCRQRNLRSVIGWQLPSLGELRSIAMAGLTPKGVLWSGTPADILGESFFTWDTENKNSAAYEETWDNGQVVCVRPRFLECDTADTKLEKR